jgi:hypothetical protein
MKKFALLLLLATFACEKEEEKLPPCEFTISGFVPGEELKDFRTTIVKDSLARFVFKDPGKRDIIPCNLPVNFKMGNVNVLVSGPYYSHPLLDLTHAPFQISTIKWIE